MPVDTSDERGRRAEKAFRPRVVFGLNANATPIWGVAEKYGVLDCLWVAEDCDIFRCGHCARLFMAGSAMVVVPDTVTIGDSPNVIRSIAAWQMANQGTATGWCVPCARRLGHHMMVYRHQVVVHLRPRERWITWWFGQMR